MKETKRGYQQKANMSHVSEMRDLETHKKKPEKTISISS